MKLLLMVTAVLEGLVGLALLLIPGIFVPLLLNGPLDTAAAIVVARLTGVALISLAIACWQSRDSKSERTVHGLVAGLTFYNFGAAAVLVYGGLRLGLQSPVMWPAMVAHAALGVWCLAAIRRDGRKTAASEQAAT